ncbi:hypothetical protein [Rhodococcus globerulus]|uniref:hypothetical protein n=1 Tax=Rhodococcus globerulus TaxID=33008 RepID=UPI000AB1B98E|nr:hypothetical protein [Rhodococcus globerulus]
MRVTPADMWWISEVVVGWIATGVFVAVWLGRAIRRADLESQTPPVPGEERV